VFLRAHFAVIDLGMPDVVWDAHEEAGTKVHDYQPLKAEVVILGEK
jgi:hypothetical protein